MPETCGDGTDQDCDGSDLECAKHTLLSPTFTSSRASTGITVTSYTGGFSGTIYRCRITWEATDPQGGEVSYRWEVTEGGAYIPESCPTDTSEVEIWQGGSNSFEAKVTVTDSSGNTDEGIIVWEDGEFREKD